MSEAKGEQTALRTKCYYTEYVNHMIRFYITCPDSLRTGGKRRADIENWCAVQSVMYRLPDEDRERIVTIYKAHHNLPLAVERYCRETGTDERPVWMLLTKVASMIARRRGLV